MCAALTLSIRVALLWTLCKAHDGFLSIREKDVSISERRYIIYDVNHGEGFNLRRDVFMRIANAVRILRENGHNCVLVLPPWGGLYHWSRGNEQIPWSRFFDVKNINQFVPVIEFQTFLEQTNHDLIDQVIYLQGYAEGWSNQQYELKYDLRDCIDGDKYYKYINGIWRGWFFGYADVMTHKFSCISIQGDSNTLAKLIKTKYSNISSLMIDRAEVILHAHFGDVQFWRTRRSMRYARHLIYISDLFRKQQLASDDLADQTKLGESWEATKNKHGDARGGNYLCVHWRRKDFTRSHNADIPSIKGTVEQIMIALKSLNLSKVFLSTDALAAEVDQLVDLLPTEMQLKQFHNQTLSDGEVSIIDQWICAHARHFIGTHTSTFSYRIQEDREILGFKPEATFNRLCPDNDLDCEQPAKWMIAYDQE